MNRAKEHRGIKAATEILTCNHGTLKGVRGKILPILIAGNLVGAAENIARTNYRDSIDTKQRQELSLTCTVVEDNRPLIRITKITCS
jgi:hypothetical protein